jgi:hypothetical protein
MTANEPTKPRHWGWSLSQRRALIALLFVLFVALCIRYALNRQYVPDPQSAQGWRYNDLLSRIDPTPADWQTLAAVPGLGEKRAREIVSYRDRLRKSNPNAVAFHAPADLRRVRGIGAATSANLRPYLVFPSDGPATEP